MKNYPNKKEKMNFTKKKLREDLKKESWNENTIQYYCEGLPELMTREEYRFHYQAFLDCVMLGGENSMTANRNHPPESTHSDQATFKQITKRFRHNYLKCG